MVDVVAGLGAAKQALVQAAIALPAEVEENPPQPGGGGGEILAGGGHSAGAAQQLGTQPAAYFPDGPKPPRRKGVELVRASLPGEAAEQFRGVMADAGFLAKRGGLVDEDAHDRLPFCSVPRSCPG